MARYSSAVWLGRAQDSFFAFPRSSPKNRPRAWQEAMMKDTLERTREPNLNLKGYLSSAYVHPVFKDDEGDDNDDDQYEMSLHGHTLVPTKRVSRRNTPVPSRCDGSSPPSFNGVDGPDLL